MAGYSGTPLVKKLGIKPDWRVHPVDPPAGYRELLAGLPDGVRFVAAADATTNLVHVFATARNSLEKSLVSLRKRLAADATVWVSWPKQASKVSTDITEAGIREIALPLGFVDVKVCAVTDVWSGLKLVVRKELR